MKINYHIKMLSYWHVGSGLDAGMGADALVLKDKNDLPYIPGKTLKGLLRDALKEIYEVQPEELDFDSFQAIFGWEEKDANDQKKVIQTHSGYAFFSNAFLPENEAKEILANNLSPYLYKTVSSTAIGRRSFEKLGKVKSKEIEGIAKNKSLRSMQVCIPVILEACISDLRVEDTDLFMKAFQWLRHIGVNRNRGLGRCKISIV